MLKATVISASAGMLVAGLVVGLALWLGSGEGIVILEGYPDGSALCDNTGDELPIAKAVGGLFNADVWNDGIATYTINEGHIDDPQVQELVKLSHVECARLGEYND